MDGPGLQRFYREVHVDDPRLVLGRFVATVFHGRCPACGHGVLTRRSFDVLDRCPVCGSRTNRMGGNALLSMPATYVASLLVVAAVGALLIPRYGFFRGLVPLLSVLGAGLVVALLRPMRLLAVWALWAFGFVYPDRMVSKGRQVLPGREEDDPVTYELEREGGPAAPGGGA